MHTGKNNWWKRVGASLLLITGFFVPAISQAGDPVLAAAKQAAGAATGACPQGGPVPIPCPPEGVFKTLEILDKDIISTATQVGVLNIGVNLISYVSERLAFELATALATGGAGQQTLIATENLSSSWQKFGLDIAGEVIGSLDEQFPEKFGTKFSLCAPSNPLIRANLAIGLKQAYQPKKPKCEWANIAQNWESAVANIVSLNDNPTGAIMAGLAQSLRPGQNELSFAIQATIATDELVNIQRHTKTEDFVAGGGFAAVTDAVTGQVKTPATLVKNLTERTFAEQEQQKLGEISDTVNSQDWGDLGIGLGLNFLNTFANTLLSSGFNSAKNLLTKGLLPDIAIPDPLLPEAVSPNDIKERLAAKFGGVKTTQPFSVTIYDALSQFNACPPGGLANRGPNNCVLDSNLLNAISRAGSGQPLTVREAMAAGVGLLHGDWPLIPPTDTARNQDSLCYTYGYCYGNIVKMRKARILPIGWEIAASLGTPQNPITLQRAVDAFDKCDTSPELCKLVDPDWILLYPESQCHAQANGEILAVKNSASRTASCVDVQSCVSKRADGSCEAYGYCVSEKNVWKFKGDACPVQFASCMTFANKAGGKSSSLLLNTVEYGVCTEANAGCLWYAVTKAVNTKGTATPSDDTYDWDGGTNADTEKRTYLNGKALQCSSVEAGCTQLYPAARLRLNLVANADVEKDADGNNVPDAWRWEGTPVGAYTKDSTGFLGSESSIQPSATADLVQDGIALTPGAFHTFSVYLRGTDAGDAVELKLTKPNGTPANVTGTNFSANTCTRAGSSYIVNVSNGANEYRRFTCTFAAPPEATFASVRLVNGSLAYDAVQLEIGETVTNFIRDGYDQTSPAATYLRVAPAYLGCTGAVTDRAECKTYAQSCSAQDVGCSLYKPTDGGPDVPATATEADRCPNECVGYAAYKQVKSLYEQEKFPVAIIPSTARSCDLRYAGCDSFTNLDAVAKGGEGVEYYTNLRACSKPEDTTEGRTYFTWEGSDAAGYQLRTWQLLKTSLTGSNAPCTAWAVENAGTPDAPRPAIRCVETATPSPVGCAAHADIFSNPDCREFYDEAGVITYRLFSKTITVAAACAPYRKTVALESDCRATGGLWTAAGECRYLGIATESASCPANVNGCRAYTGGAGNNLRTTLEETFEPPAFQTGSLSGVGSVTPILTSESIATGGHSLGIINAGAGGGFGGALTGRITVGKTYSFEFWAKGNGQVQVAFVQNDGTVRPIGAPVTVTGDWKSFAVGPVDTAPWTGFDDRASLRMTLVAPGSFYVDNIRLKESLDTIGIVKNSWVIPASCDRGPGVDGTPGTGAIAPQYYLGCKAYTETKSNQTAAFYQFTRLCSASAVGCQQFFDTRNSKESAGHIYNAVCSGTAAVTAGTDCVVRGIKYCTIQRNQSSCTFEYAATALPQNPAASAFLLSFGPDTRVVRNDAATYLVDNGQASCAEASVGCQEVGQPTFNQDRTKVVSYKTAYLFDRPDEYKDLLCTDSALFCAAWGTQSNGVFFFKDPGEQVCEYRTNVRRADGRSYTGWFRKGTTDACASNNVKAGDQYGIWRNGDSSYANWVGLCENQYDLCTEFVDTTDTTAVTNKGKEYTYLAKGNLSSTEANDCNGQASQRAGCILLNNTNILDLPYAAGPSYVSSTHADVLYGGKQNELRSPISCLTPTSGEVKKQDGTTVNLCQLRCAYQVGANRNLRTGLRVEGPSGNELVGACLTSADCPTMETDTGRKVTGTCVDVAAPVSATNPIAYGLQYAHKNDSNMVQSVVRGRECAEWLACQSSYSAWDDQNNKYVPICEQVRLYRDFKNGQNVEPVQDVSLEPISAQAYMSRDLSWYGLEYSGYSVPGMVPVPAIKHLNVNPVKWCMKGAVVLNDPTTKTPRSCATTSNCTSLDAAATCENASSDYRSVVVAGTCVESTVKRGGECRVGSCRISGNRCNQDRDCGTGDTCLIGYCQEVSGRTCTNDAGCAQEASAKTCDTSRGRCVNVRTSVAQGATGTKCSAKDQCSGKQSCFDYPGARTGACYNNLCLTDFMDRNGDGRADPLTVDVAEPLSCRGYPEISSPFPQQIVSSWTDYGANGKPLAKPIVGGNSKVPPALDSLGSRPYTYKNGFDQVPVCAPVDCDAAGKNCKATDDCTRTQCSYEKIVYGEGTATKYFDRDHKIPTEMGVCMGSSLNGKSCANDIECRVDPNVPAGTCQFPTRQETKIGWQGYCLEYDTSIQLFGSQDPKDRPCLTWFPTDSVKGATDLFGKDLQAGYFSGEDEFYCTETEVYYDIGTNIWASGNSPVDVSCLDSQGDPACTDSLPDTTELADLMCPRGFYAVVTGCDAAAPYDNVATKPDDGKQDENARVCAMEGNKSENADFPYICVPKYAVKVGANGVEEPCVPPGETISDGTKSYVANGSLPASVGPIARDSKVNVNINHTSEPSGAYSIDAYLLNATEFNKARVYYDKCEVRGLTKTDLYGGSNPKNAYFTPADDIGIVRIDGIETRASHFDAMTIARRAYLGCRELVQTSSGSIASSAEAAALNPAGAKVYNMAWTDRTWTEFFKDNTTRRHAIKDLQYTLNTQRKPFGKAPALVALTALDKKPFEAVMSAAPTAASLVASSYERATFREVVKCDFLIQGQDNPSIDHLTCDGVPSVGGAVAICTDEGGNGGLLLSDIGPSYNPPEAAAAGAGQCADPPCLRSTTIRCFLIDAETLKVRPSRLDGKFCRIRVDYTGSREATLIGVDCAAPQDGKLCIDARDDLAAATGSPTICADMTSTTAVASPNSLLDILALDKNAPDPTGLPKQRLDSIFQKAIKVFQWNKGLSRLGSNSTWVADFGQILAGQLPSETLGKYGTSSGVPTSGSLSGLSAASAKTSPTPPKVASIGACDSNGCKESKEGQFSVNGLEAGILQGTDGQKSVNVSFFMWADSEQMPLRRVIVDWGDGYLNGQNADSSRINEWPTNSQTGSTAEDNFYKNRRGLTVDGAQICGNTQANDSFGYSAQACESGYVNFIHDYVCSASLQLNLPVCNLDPATGRLRNSPCKGGVPDAGNKCVYQPRVQAVDNWGWCAGTCPGGADGTNQCFGNECKTTWPDPLSEDTTYRGSNPWVYYSGYVLVEPSK